MKTTIKNLDKIMVNNFFCSYAEVFVLHNLRYFEQLVRKVLNFIDVFYLNFSLGHACSLQLKKVEYK